MTIAIIGSRNLNPSIQLGFMPDKIISGGAFGVDTCAEDYARNRGIVFEKILPDYKKYGRSAPIIRNRIIVDSADAVYAYWDGKSKGTKMVIDYAKSKGKRVELFIFSN